MYFQLGWRNIWRNKKRTAVILTAVVIGVWCMIVMGALMRGMLDEMLRNGISTLTGHIQVHHKGYQADPVVENSITDPEVVYEAMEKTLPPGSLWTKRICVPAVAANARHNAGVTLVGIVPETEARVSFIGEAVREGEYLAADDDYGVLVGKALLDKFGARLGQKIILMSQGTSKEISSRAFKIRGVFRADMEATEKGYVFVTLPAAQKMLGLGDGISETAVTLAQWSRIPGVLESLRADLPADRFEVMDWKELLPMLSGYLGVVDWFTYLWYLVVFIAMGFGIVNTTLMAVSERMREFGLQKALGMKPFWIIKEVLAEALCLLVLGIVIGNALGLATSAWIFGNGIDLSSLAQGTEYWGMPRIIYPRIAFNDLAVANAVVFVLGILVCLYPAAKAARFTPVEAMTRA